MNGEIASFYLYSRHFVASRRTVYVAASDIGSGSSPARSTIKNFSPRERFLFYVKRITPWSEVGSGCVFSRVREARVRRGMGDFGNHARWFFGPRGVLVCRLVRRFFCRSPHHRERIDRVDRLLVLERGPMLV